MLKNKKNIFIPILSAIIAGIICSIIVYSFMSQSSQEKSFDLYGTYQLNIRTIDNTEYLAVIPPLTDNTTKNINQFQWYNVDKKVLSQGTYKMNKKGFITFYVDGKSIATLFAINGKYYFVQKSLEPKEITQISKEPIVSSPLE